MAGVLRITVGAGKPGGGERLVPTLAIRGVREWQRKVTEQVPKLEAAIDEDGRIGDMGDFVDETLDAILDLVVAYDTSAALGGREWLETNADPTEVYEAARQMGAVSFPFVRDLQTLRLLLASGARRAARSAEPSSTSGPSPSGGSGRPPSKTDSTPGS